MMNSPRGKGSCQPKRQNLKTCRVEAPPRRHQSKPNRVEKFWSAFFSRALFYSVTSIFLDYRVRPVHFWVFWWWRGELNLLQPDPARRDGDFRPIWWYHMVRERWRFKFFFCWEARQKWGICCLWSRNLINSSSDGSYSRRRGPKWTWWSMWSELEVITCERNIE